ncbi:MAG: twin-arginine translocation pathway signal [Alishewanella sp. 34-51-39]|nr:MAG: twin-arginine translocation pathway signal [Alishewanella sp. 34-51-39]
MNRRQFLTAAAWTPIVVVLGAKLTATIRPYPLQQLLTQLRALKPDALQSSGSWTVSEILQHCAQSIRYSISGYPQAYSALFQNTAGKLALNLFAATGSMHHPLDQPIPGAPALIPELPNDVALRELTFELQQFINWQGPLAPHFAYGSLTKAQYYSVHYLHLQSHLAEIN